MFMHSHEYSVSPHTPAHEYSVSPIILTKHHRKTEGCSGKPGPYGPEASYAAAFV